MTASAPGTAAGPPAASGAPTPIRLWWGGRAHEVSGLAATTTLLEWLRIAMRATGSKEGCAEGDCGACLVALAELDPEAPGGVSLRTVNSCIHLLAMVDGKAVLTIEDLAPAGAALHPVQQAMVDCHASQCGFCTPGFVMALFDLYEREAVLPTREAACAALSGNLCRCTGYRPILAAVDAAWRLPRRPLDRAPLRAALERLATRPPLDYRAPAEVGGGRVQAPDTLAGLADALRQPQARVLAGATDIGLWITKQARPLPHLVHLDRVPELHRLQECDGELVIGAAVTHSEAWPALVRHVPALAGLARRFAGPPVCNAGTLGGNVANGSPIGDGMPPLLALDARVRLQLGAAVRELPLADFYLGYQRSVLQPGEFLRELVVPLPGPATRMACYKVSKRHDQDISALCAALRIDLEDGLIRSARVAFGGMAATPARAPRCEAALAGGRLDAVTLAAAQQALAADYTPLSDLRASAGYRTQVAQRLLARWWHTLGALPGPARLEDLEAWA